MPKMILENGVGRNSTAGRSLPSVFENTKYFWGAIVAALVLLLLIPIGLWLRKRYRKRQRNRFYGRWNGRRPPRGDYEQVAVVELRTPQFDSEWFERMWQRIDDEDRLLMTSQCKRDEQLELTGLDTLNCATIEDRLEQHKFTVIASGPRQGREHVYFFAQDGGSYRFCLCVLHNS